jgi:hypothetical protein
VELPPDLTSPRPNLEIGITIRAIQSDVRHMAKEKDPVARRGYAYVLIAHLEHLVASPDPLPPLLREGTVDNPDDWLADDALPAGGRSHRAARPFENPDASAGHYFVEFNGRLSALFADLPADDRPFMGFPGPWVFVHRLAHTTKTPTSRSLDGAAGLARVAELIQAAPDGPRSKDARLLIDPRGYSRSRGAVPGSLVIGTVADLTAAIAGADELSAALGIRLVVTTTARLIDNH